MENMTTEQMQSVKDSLSFPLSLLMAWDSAKADGKIELSDLPLLMAPATKIVSAISAVPKMLDAVKSMSDEDSAEIGNWAKSTFDIADDDVEEKIEDGIKLVIDLARYLTGFVGE